MTIMDNKSALKTPANSEIAILENSTWVYPFSFKGQKRDDKIAGSGNIITDTFWEYDAMLGRRQS
jgi:hypothetical protein